MNPSNLPPALAALHRSLGIPDDYAAQRGLIPQTEAAETELVEIGINRDGRVLRLTRHAASAWTEMKTNAARDAVELVAISAFRSVERQTELIRAKLARGQSVAEILRTLAAPGFSEHHTGRAIDLVSPSEPNLTEKFADTPTFRWLDEHAARFGYTLSFPRNNPHGIAYEPWHWCWHA